MVRAFTNSWGGGGFAEFDVEFKFAKIQNSHFGGGGGFAEFDVEFKFAKIQNSHLCVGGGGGWWNQFPTFDAESKFALKKKIFFCEKFSKFSGKNVPGNGFRLWIQSGSL